MTGGNKCKQYLLWAAITTSHKLDTLIYHAPNMVKLISIAACVLIIVILNDVNYARARQNKRGTGMNRSNFQKTPRIIDGTPATDGQWPFVASIQHNGKHICGGSIIGERWILTACHCFAEGYGTIPEYELKAAVGSIWWRSGVKYDIFKLIMHEEYNDYIVVNDIALIMLAKSITFNHNIQPIKLSPVNLDDERDVIIGIVIGWGFINSGQYLVAKASESLNFVQLQSIPWYRCRNYYADIFPTNLCMTSASMKGSCNGDSGGPLVTYNEYGLVQIGLVSYGEDCNNTTPEVYTRVPMYLTWVRSKMNLNLAH